MPEYYVNYREECRGLVREYYVNYREECRGLVREYYVNYREECRGLVREYYVNASIRRGLVYYFFNFLSKHRSGLPSIFLFVLDSYLCFLVVICVV